MSHASIYIDMIRATDESVNSHPPLASTRIRGLSHTRLKRVQKVLPDQKEKKHIPALCAVVKDKLN